MLVARLRVRAILATLFLVLRCPAESALVKREDRDVALLPDRKHMLIAPYMFDEAVKKYKNSFWVACCVSSAVKLSGIRSHKPVLVVR